ncbi:MAG TPA: efflux RND transporter periplasmic adaptor subunit [Gemmatimonadales bacterium]|jgi:multidrug efflux system membrane fusion protein
MMPRLRPLALALTSLLAVAACDKRDAAAPAAVPVMVAAVERRPVPFELGAPGVVEPLQTVSVQPQVSGLLERVAFTEGQEVQKGQVLFLIDARPFQATLAQALATLARDSAQAANADQDVKRYSALAEKEYVTAQQYDQARTTAAAATATLSGSRAAVDQARLNLQYATIRAPIAGRTGALRVRAGNLVRTGDTAPLVTINQIRPILVRFAVPAAHLGLIQRYSASDPPVRAEPAGGGAVSAGTLSFVDNAVDTTTGTILLKGSFPNTDGALWPGEFVNVRVRLYEDENALVVPASAVVSGQQGSLVFVVQPDSTAKTIPVTVARTSDSVAVVSGGLSPGDRVVTDGQLRLRSGSKIQIKTPGTSARAGAGAS